MPEQGRDGAGVGKRERERERESLAGFIMSVQSPTWRSIPQTVRS